MRRSFVILIYILISEIAIAIAISTTPNPWWAPFTIGWVAADVARMIVLWRRGR